MHQHILLRVEEIKRLVCGMMARFDMVELFVKSTEKNKEILDECLGELLWDIYDLMGEEKRKRKLFQSKDVQCFSNGDQNILVAVPIKNQKNNLMRIRITHEDKWNWELHNKFIRSAGDLLDIHKLEYGVSKAEIAFDTIDEEEGNNFVRSVYMKWGRGDQIFNYQSGKKRRGGSKNGWNEYNFHRIFRRRQSHSYVKGMRRTDWWVSEKIYRWELKLFRKYLRRRRVETVDDLFENARELVESAITFKELDKRKLKRDIKKARHWRLDNKSIPEQYRILKRHGLSHSKANKYFKQIPWPEICFSPELVNTIGVSQDLIYGLTIQ